MLPHVSLGEIFKPNECEIKYEKSRNQYINAFHVDFLICVKYSMTPLIAIEFDGGCHSEPDQQLRDAFKNELFNKEKIPLLRFNYKQYKEENIIKEITQELNNAKVYCEVCGSEMTFRKGKDGKNDFLGCKNYHSNGCRYTRQADFKYVS